MKTSRRLNGVQSLNAVLAFALHFSVLLLGSFASLTALHAQSNYATPYTFTTLAGAPSGGYVDGSGSAVRFFGPTGVAVDVSGNVFVADRTNQTIRKISSAGVVTTLAGMAGVPGSADGTGTAARFSSPYGVAVDESGNVYVADSGNHAIRKINSAGLVTTLAGVLGSSGYADGLGSAARFYFPEGVAADGLGNVYVVDTFNNIVRKINSAGAVSTLAGSAGNTGTTDGLGSVARFGYYPAGIALDSVGNLYVADGGAIRKITAAGNVTTMALPNDGAREIPFLSANGVAVDSAGNVYVAESGNNMIRKITPQGYVSEFAGRPNFSYLPSVGSADGTGGEARFNSPFGVAVDGSGNVYVADSGNNTIRKITESAVVSTFAGTASSPGSNDSNVGPARFNTPRGIAVDGLGNVYVADTSNNKIRLVSATGEVVSLAGTIPYGSPATSPFFYPYGMAIDSAGVIFLADTYHSTIWSYLPYSFLMPMAGPGGDTIQFGSTDGTGSAARFYLPQGVTVDHTGSVYVADTYNHTIRKITSGGVVTTFAGIAGSTGSDDGTGSAAKFNTPIGMGVDTAGNIYVGDSGNHVIRKITPAGVVTTFAGSAGNSGSADGSGSAARFNSPEGVAVDGSGNVYVADSCNHLIRKISPDGNVTTLAGLAEGVGTSDGTGSLARFYHPSGVTVDGSGNVYVADSYNNTIRRGELKNVAPIITNQPTGKGVALGASATFSISAIGVPAPTFQWEKNNVVIGGATGSSYTIASAASGDAGSYTVVVSNAIGSTKSNIASLNLIPGGFNVSAYYARNPDVAAVFGADHYGAWLYYRDHGIYDGEVFDDLFRVEEYLTLYPELFTVFGDNLTGALMHWLNEGSIEGRLGRIPLEFSATGYLSRNPDVAAAVNNDPLLAWSHYWLYGIYEGRAYDEELRVFEYLAVNADLTAAFVNDWRAAALHWMRYGRTEGRLGRLPLIFNVTEYLTRSPDVAAAWGTHPTTVFLHYWGYGIDEGRTFDDEFRPAEYLALNADLAAVFGTDKRGAFKHWVRYGKTEGRPGKNP